MVCVVGNMSKDIVMPIPKALAFLQCLVAFCDSILLVMFSQFKKKSVFVTVYH